MRFLNRNQPLWMPGGSVRSILALVLVLATVALVLSGQPAPDNFYALVVAVVSFYFAGAMSTPPSK